MSFAVHISVVKQKVAIDKVPATVATAEAARVMVLDRFFICEILAVYAAVASTTQAAVECVIIELAIWPVVQNENLGRIKPLAAFSADKASLMITACQTAVGRGYTLARDIQSASPALVS
jgi:hypothetical protein